MKKSYAAWAVLLAITLIAGLALAMTNAVTKDTIAEQEKQKAEIVRQKLVAEAEGFTLLEVPEASGTPRILELYEGAKDGSAEGYVATVLNKGFGGEIEVTVGFDKAAVLSGISVGGANFSETAGLGAKSKDAAFTDQFIGKQTPLRVIKAGGTPADNTVDAITAATITSNAVTNAVNAAGEYVREMLGLNEEEELEAGSRTATASAQGFAGPVAVTITLDDAGKISEMSIGDDSFSETEGFGARALEPACAEAFIGLTPPLEAGDVDVLSGATFTRNAVITAVNQAAEKIKSAASSGAKASEQGFAGPVAVSLTLDGSGAIETLVIGDDSFSETEGFGARALEPECAEAFIGLTPPLEAGDVDVLSGATFTKNALVKAINKAAAKLANAGTAEAPAAEEPAAGEPAAKEEPAAEAPAAEEPAEGTKVIAQGLTGGFAVTVAFNEDGTVKSIKVGESDSDMDKSFLAMANTEEFLGQIIGKATPVEGVDVTGGATISKTAILNAVNELGAANAPAVAEPAADEGTKVIAQGLTGSFPVTVAFNEDGTVKSVTLGASDSDMDTSFLANVNTEAFLSQFAGKATPIEGIDTVAGATISSKAVISAVNELGAANAPAAEPAAEEGATVKAQGLTGSFPVTVAFNEDGTVKSVTLGASDSDMDTSFLANVNTEAFLGQFVGKATPVEGIDTVAGATISSKAVISAVNELGAANAPATAEPAAEEGTKVIAQGLTGSFPVTVAFNEDGTVKSVTLGASDSDMDTSFLANVNTEAFLGQFAGKATPIEGIDTVAGATISSKAVISAVNELGAANAPAAEPAAEEGATVKAQGLTGSFPVTVVFNEDGTVKSVTLGASDSDMDTSFLANVNTEAFLGQFVGKATPIEGIDTVAGATISSKAVISAVNELGAANAPAAEPAAEEGATVKAQGLTGSFPVTVAFNEDGTVKTVTLGASDSDMDTSFLANVNTEAFLGQFAGKATPIEGIDTVAGATISSKAVINAVNEAAQQ